MACGCDERGGVGENTMAFTSGDENIQLNTSQSEGFSSATSRREGYNCAKWMHGYCLRLVLNFWGGKQRQLFCSKVALGLIIHKRQDKQITPPKSLMNNLRNVESLF